MVLNLVFHFTLKLSKELAANRLAGPFDAPPFANFRVSPLGVVPKKTSGEYRLIRQLSYPNGDYSLNDGISSDYSTVNYARVDDANCNKVIRSWLFSR